MLVYVLHWNDAMKVQSMNVTDMVLISNDASE
jgi:hypothetical protein